jgi:hypothetical protein
LLKKQAKAKVFFIYFCALLIKYGLYNFFDYYFGRLVSSIRYQLFCTKYLIPAYQHTSYQHTNCQHTNCQHTNVDFFGEPPQKNSIVFDYAIFLCRRAVRSSPFARIVASPLLARFGASASIALAMRGAKPA